ncbi:MAG: BrnT family toxin [Maritimibacter sp.]|nr:BrnT family toxin [Maritimibacter sp.]
MEFEYDPAKSAGNAEKHGIDFEAAQEIWSDGIAVVVDARSVTEPRSIIIGRIGAKLWTAVFTMREGKVRIISVRRARKNEWEIYLGG